MTALSSTTLALAHRQFEAALPVLRKDFRYLLRRRWRDRDDLFAEAMACAWKAWVGLLARGRDPVAVGLSGIARYSARHTLAGRRISNRHGGGRGKMDVHHPRARERGGYKVISLDDGPADRNDYGPAAWKDWVATNHRLGPAEAAAFKIDFSAYLDSLSERRRRTAELLAEGRGTLEVAEMVGVSPAAVSQARTYLERRWREFIQEPAAAAN